MTCIQRINPQQSAGPTPRWMHTGIFAGVLYKKLMSKEKKGIKRGVSVRAAQLPRLAAELFRLGKDGERVRTVMMKVDLSPEALAPFAPLAPDADSLKDRLDYVMDEWTGATRHMMNRVREDLFERRRDILLSVATERDYDAIVAAERGWLEDTGEKFVLGTPEHPLDAPICRHYKVGKEMVSSGTHKAKTILCAKVSDGLYLKLELKKAEVEGGEEGGKEEAVEIKSFDAQALGGFLSAAYWSGFEGLKKTPYTFGPLGEGYVRSNRDRTRLKHLSDERFAAQVGEALRQKVAENICSFLEKYYSVQPEVRRFNESVRNAVERSSAFIEKHGLLQDDKAGKRVFSWRLVADGFRPCDGSDPVDVERMREWTVTYNMRLNELVQVLGEGLLEEAKAHGALQQMKPLKGYPGWPEYKADETKVFAECLSKLQEMSSPGPVTGTSLRNWIIDAYVDGETRRRDYLGGRNGRNQKRDLPLRIKVAREIFARTGGKITPDESGAHHYAWTAKDVDVTAVGKSVVERLWRDFEVVTRHSEAVPSDYLAKRRQVDLLVVIANLTAMSKPEAERSRFLAEVNRTAGETKGVLLKTAEGTQEEVQISGFSVKPSGKGGAWALQKNACLLVAGESGERETLALLFDPSGSKDDPVTIASNKGPVRAIGYAGGADKRDSTEEQQTRVLCAGFAEGVLGAYGLLLPLRFGSSQARRYFYPANGHREDGIVGAMMAGRVDVGSARIIRKIASGGKPEYFVALSVKLPRPELEYRVVAPEGFIGVDRGETHLAVMAETDLGGRLVAPPEPYGNETMNRVARAYKRLKRNQSQMKRLEGGSWFEARITNAVRLIAIKATEMMLTRRKAIVFEDLSRGFARGGTASWEHQYTKVIDHLRDVLAFSGLMTKDVIHYSDKNIKRGYQWFGVVGAAYTSQTCPSCGTIWGKPEKFDRDGRVIRVSWDDKHALRPGLRSLELRENGTTWVLAWPDSKTSLPPAIAKDCAAYVSASNKASKEAKRAEGRISEWLRHRPRTAYDRFRCRWCGEELHADKSAALNIARKALFQQTAQQGKRGRGEWQAWYLGQLEHGDWWNDQVKAWLK